MTTIPDAESVSDPTDFPKEIKGLRALDESLRCSICLEVFDAPMSLPCGHSFCSLCIRQNILTRNECARCRKQADEFHLTKNAQLEEAALSWKVSRPAVLDMIMRLEDAKAEAAQLRVRLEKGKSKTSPPFDVEGSEGGARPNKRRRTSATPNDEASSTTVVAEEEEEEDTYPEYVPSSDVEEQDIVEDGVVGCPMGTHKTYMKHINAHIDSGCKVYTLNPGHRPKTAPASSSTQNKSSAKSAWNSVFQSNSRTSSKDSGKGKDSQSPSTTSTTERLPKVSYSVQKDKRIRELLQEHGLSITGTREQQIIRHQHFITLFNANLDRPPTQRKTTDELRIDLRKWEESLSVKKVEVTNPKAYLKKNSDHFNAQIKALKEQKKREKAAVNHNEGDMTTGTGTDVPPDEHGGDVVSDSEGEGEIQTKQ